MGDAGHINAACGRGPWPKGRQVVEHQIEMLHRPRRIGHVHPIDLSFAA
jgi:hypothetical protein